MQQAIRIAQFLTLGYTSFGAKGFKHHARSFNPNALDVDLSGRHVIVTGATSGLGRVTAHNLATRHATVHLVCRDLTRGHSVRKAILADTADADIRVHQCDLSSLADVSRLANHFVSEDVPVGVLVNNAGVMKHQVEMSNEKHESAFATNSLGTFALTEMLRPALEKAQDARVITVSSGGMLTEALEVDDLEGMSLRKDSSAIDGSAQYARCKRRQVALTEYWARKYADKGIFWASMHPGWASTPGVRLYPSFSF